MPTNRRPRIISKRIRFTPEILRLFKEALEDREGAVIGLHLALNRKPWDYFVHDAYDPTPPPTVTDAFHLTQWAEAHAVFKQLEAES